MLKDNNWNSRFLGSRNSYEEGDVILVGAPMDYTVSYRPGTRYGPQKVRETSYGLEEYSPYLDRRLSSAKFFDAGDLELPFGNTQESLDMIGDAASEIFHDDKKPIFVGGEHLISFPIIREAHRKYGRDLVLLHFDAHTDLRLEYYGQPNSHASVIRRCTEFLTLENIYQFGIRSGEEDEFKWAIANINFYPFEVLEPFKKVVHQLKGRPLYLTLDIDVFDPAYACGTGTPEPGGCTPQEIFQVIKLLKDFDIVGMDVVEISPVYDPSDRTPILGAKIIREALVSFFGR